MGWRRHAIAFVLLCLPLCARAVTPSLTPLTPAQQAAQFRAVGDFDKHDHAAALPIFTACKSAPKWDPTQT
jgi:hypothetical protein